MGHTMANITRRELLKLLGTATAASFLAACAPKTMEPTMEPTEVVVVEDDEPKATAVLADMVC